AEVDQGTNPLDGLPVQTGVIASSSTPGLAVDVWAGNDLVVTAESTGNGGAGGISVFNAYRGMNPAIITHVPTPADAVRVAGAGNFIAAVLAGNGGLSVIDISTPANARIIHQVPLAGALAVTADAGTAYVELSSGLIVAIDLASGRQVDQVFLTRTSQGDLALAGDYLYAVTDNQLYAISMVKGAFTLAGSTNSPRNQRSNERVFAGGN